MGHVPEAGRYRWVVFGMFVTCNTSGFLIANTIGILLPAISQDIGISPMEQGMLSSAPFWANLTLMVLISWWTSRYPPKILVTMTMVLGALSLFIQGWGPAFVWLMLGRLAFGVTMIAREPARSLLIRQWLPQREVNIAGGVSNLFFGVIVSGGLLLTPVLLRVYGGDWRAVMNTFGVVFIVLGVTWVLLGRERELEVARSETTVGVVDSNAEGSIVKRAFGFREVWVAGLGFTGALMSFASFNSFLPTLALESYGISLGGSGLIAALYVLPGGFSGILVGYLLKGTEGRAPVLAVAGLVIAASFAGMTLTESYPVLLGLAVANGLAWGFFPILYMVPFHLEGIRPREIAVAVAVVMSMASLGSSVGPTLTGYLQETQGSLQVALRIISLSPLTLVVAAGLLHSENQKKV